jgi:hypothetical protein
MQNKNADMEHYFIEYTVEQMYIYLINTQYIYLLIYKL